MENLVLTATQFLALQDAFARNGWSSTHVDQMCVGSTLGEFLQVLCGQAEIRANAHIIDCDARPAKVPVHSDICLHKPGGQMLWDSSNVEITRISTARYQDLSVEDMAAAEPFLNARVLEYLLQHPHLIPESWKKKENGKILFLGTLYKATRYTRHSRGQTTIISARYLTWHGNVWRSGSFQTGWLRSGFNGKCSAAKLIA